MELFIVTGGFNSKSKIKGDYQAKAFQKFFKSLVQCSIYVANGIVEKTLALLLAANMEKFWLRASLIA